MEVAQSSRNEVVRDSGSALPADGPTRPAESLVSTVRLMTYNIERGFQWPAALGQIQSRDPDIICLQEVPQQGSREARVMCPSRILRDIKLRHDHQLLWNRHPTRIGNMTLTRGRIEPGEVLHTPMTRPYGMVNRVSIGRVSLLVANIHLSPLIGPPPLAFPLTELLRLKEVVHLTRRLKRHLGPVIAAGDFNSFWPAPAAAYMSFHWRDCRMPLGSGQPGTRPTYGLGMVIDHVFLRHGVTVTDYEVLPGGGSDHRAVFVTLSVRGQSLQ